VKRGKGKGKRGKGKGEREKGKGKRGKGKVKSGKLCALCILVFMECPCMSRRNALIIGLI
jgi:hypothetical protein